MPVTHRIDPRARIVHLVASGDVEQDHWGAALLAALRDPAFCPGFGFLLDARDQTGVCGAEFTRPAAALLTGLAGRVGEGR